MNDSIVVVSPKYFHSGRSFNTPKKETLAHLLDGQCIILVDETLKYSYIYSLFYIGTIAKFRVAYRFDNVDRSEDLESKQNNP